MCVSMLWYKTILKKTQAKTTTKQKSLQQQNKPEQPESIPQSQECGWSHQIPVCTGRDLSSDTKWRLSSNSIFRMNVFCNSVFTFLLLRPFLYLIILTVSGYCARRNGAPGAGVSLRLALSSHNSCANYINASSSCFKATASGPFHNPTLLPLPKIATLGSILPPCHLTSAVSRTLSSACY